MIQYFIGLPSTLQPIAPSVARRFLWVPLVAAAVLAIYLPGLGNDLVFDDGMRGHPPGAPYDSIIAAAGAREIPQAWLDQLAVGGRLVSPVQQPGSREQALVVVDRLAEGFARSIHGAVKFVPLKSGLAR